jgi:hypothetical protein
MDLILLAGFRMSSYHEMRHFEPISKEGLPENPYYFCSEFTHSRIERGFS